MTLAWRRRHWGWALLTLAVAVIGARLGLWQLDRAAQKQAWHAAVVQRATLAPLGTAQLAAEPAASAAQWHRPVRLMGRWVPERTVLLDNRQMNGRPGFFVLTLLELEDGRALLVQRGWLPRDAQERTRVAVPLPPTGTVPVTGRLAPPPSRLMDFGDAGQGAIRQNLDLAAYGAEIGRPLLPATVLQSVESADSDPLRRDWPRPVADVAKHHGYAFQWFALSALAIILYAWYSFRRPAATRA